MKIDVLMTSREMVSCLMLPLLEKEGHVVIECGFSSLNVWKICVRKVGGGREGAAGGRDE